jgi:hypothetical protein
MFNKKPPRWLRHGDYVINLDKVEAFRRQSADSVNVFFTGEDTAHITLRGISLDDIHHFLKHGKPRAGCKIKHKEN